MDGKVPWMWLLWNNAQIMLTTIDTEKKAKKIIKFFHSLLNATSCTGDPCEITLAGYKYQKSQNVWQIKISAICSAVNQIRKKILMIKNTYVFYNNTEQIDRPCTPWNN